MTSKGEDHAGASGKHGSAKPGAFGGRILKLLTHPRVLLVLVTVSLWAYYVDSIQKTFPFLLTAQLKFHQILSNLEPWKSRLKWVTPVEIDDAAFWSPPLSGTQPTNRRYLADLALAAAKAGAAVVVLDFQLKSPTGEPGDDEVRKRDNEYLLNAVREITQKGVRVVLSCGLVGEGSGKWKREPNIFPDNALPQGARVGYINVPADPRQIPLRVRAMEWDGASEKFFFSLALQSVDAYEDSHNIKPPTMDNKKIRQAMDEEKFVYGRFLNVSEFRKVSSPDLIGGRASPESCCGGRIVLIGGTWHQYGMNRGSLVDTHPSPVGEIPGLYLHANYIEALLDEKYKHEVPHWFAVLIDLVLSLMIYIGFDLADPRGWRFPLILIILIVPLSAAYLLFATSGLYLDCIMPLAACFADLGLEHYMDLRRRAKNK